MTTPTPKKPVGSRESGIEGNLPSWKGASRIYSKAYAYMNEHGEDCSLIDALNSGDEEAIKGNMLRINSEIFRGKKPNVSWNQFMKILKQ